MNKREKTRELLSHLIKSSQASVQQLRIALIKAGQSNLLKLLSQNDIQAEEEDIAKSYDGRCFIHLQGDTYIVAKEFKGNLYIHIRNYDQTGTNKIPTKQGATLNLSR